jgi:DNA-binding transcriptional ArsR family regulator
MKIPMMQSIRVMNKTPDFKVELSRSCAERVAKGKSNRALCFKLIKEGERSIVKLAELVKIHKSTVLVILKEFRDGGLIELAKGRAISIARVAKG